MKKTKMILFDYGGTLMYEPDFEPSNGNKAIYPYISENPHNYTQNPAPMEDEVLFDAYVVDNH